MTLSRRDLLAAGAAAAGAAAGATVLGGGRTHAAPSTAAPAVGSTTSNVLVVIQLGGGNDALNTLVPDVGPYRDLRPGLQHDFAACVPVPGAPGYALHPAMAPLAPLLAAGRIATIAGLGMPGQDLSHFRAFDYWWSATATSPVQTGWLGRWLAETGGTATSPMRAVALRAGAVAFRHPSVLTVSVVNPNRFKDATPRGGQAAPLRAAWAGGAPGATGPAAQLWASHQVADQAMSLVSSIVAGLPPGTSFGAAADHLRFAADLIIADPTVQLVQVPAAASLDTHAGQRVPHATIWADLSAGIVAMYDKLAAAGHDGRVLTITVSEFGRRVQENASGGTDHGKGGVQFAIGPMVQGGLINGWDLANLDQGDLSIDEDARGLYAAALGWLGGPIDSVLGGSYAPLPILRSGP